MNFLKKKKKQKLHYVFDSLLLFLILYFLYYGINGSNGLLNLIKFNDELKTKEKILFKLEVEKNFLQVKNNGLYSKTLDLDILEEQAKLVLGYADKNEIVVLINE